jgi:exopolyphosphatase/guanosine-5'-triphosphate,3'-diphosphate pyrophosphatase
MKERIEKLKLRPDRADVIVPASVLVQTIMRQAEVEKIMIPGVGLRDGIIWSML